MEITRSVLVLHPALDMYRLVHDVDAYPQFLSWCTHAEVIEQSSEVQLASLEVSVGGISRAFTTRNRLVRGESLYMSLVDGPFQSFSGQWEFQPLGDAGSKVSLSLEFSLTAGLLGSAFGKGFAHIADRLVKDFGERAEVVYGGSGAGNG